MNAQFPNIHQLFLNHNTAVPASASVERLFRVAGDVFSRKRGNITGENFERRLFCLSETTNKKKTMNHETKTVVRLVDKVTSKVSGYFSGNSRVPFKNRQRVTYLVIFFSE